MLEKLNQIPVQLRLCTYIYIYTQKRNISVIYNKEHYFLMKKHDLSLSFPGSLLLTLSEGRGLAVPARLPLLQALG